MATWLVTGRDEAVPLKLLSQNQVVKFVNQAAKVLFQRYAVHAASSCGVVSRQCENVVSRIGARCLVYRAECSGIMRCRFVVR